MNYSWNYGVMGLEYVLSDNGAAILLTNYVKTEWGNFSSHLLSVDGNWNILFTREHL